VKGGGWITFSGIILMLAGAMDFFNGLWALSAKDTAVDAIFWDGNLDAWGWFYVVLGVILIGAGFAVFNRQPWAVWTGIVFASIAAILNMFWIFTYPIASMTLVLINLLVIYGLAVYGTEEGTTA
jgi:hypothetical protein